MQFGNKDRNVAKQDRDLAFRNFKETTSLNNASISAKLNCLYNEVYDSDCFGFMI